MKKALYDLDRIVKKMKSICELALFVLKEMKKFYSNRLKENPLIYGPLLLLDILFIPIKIIVFGISLIVTKNLTIKALYNIGLEVLEANREDEAN